MKCGLFSKYEYSVAVCFIATGKPGVPMMGIFFPIVLSRAGGWGFFFHFGRLFGEQKDASRRFFGKSIVNVAGLQVRQLMPNRIVEKA